MRGRFRTALVAAVITLAAPAGAAATPGTQRSPGEVPSTTADTATGSTTSVTLITGDRVVLQRVSNGKQAATIEPGPGRERVSFHQLERDGELHIIPADVVPYLAADLLDPNLFNITALIEQGYDDEGASALPLILGYRNGVDAARSKSRSHLAAVSTGPVLESINALAVAADKATVGTFWESIDDDRVSTSSATTPRLAGGIERIWLDRRVRATLDRSVPQIGAPHAWDAGLDGTGVTVAVLDSGVDADHPDLAGVVVAEKDFTGGSSPADTFGHGTHVASIVAGSGAASGGDRRGVAPGARIISGKVLDDTGFGLESWVLDGMEWAADSGADVVNMSLGGPSTDGTDPLSQALDALTERTGVLFVVSAGNSGEAGEFTVGSPGVATRALTVGAVDRDESLAPFSSRGPRWGDLAVKPDITAPGVGILAARAGGTELGQPDGEYYTALSGTSMAAPHVAGAAAILAQRHPEWRADQLKDALVSTAARNPSLTVFEQGGGRVDVARAVQQGVYGTGTLDLGLYPDEPDAPEVRKKVTYTNVTDRPVTLRLDLALRGWTGDLPEGAVRLDRSEVQLAPHSTQTVTLMFDPDAVPRGRYAGYLTATGEDGVVVHTSLGLVKEPPRHTVTISAVGRDGEPTFVNTAFLVGEDPRFDVPMFLEKGQSRTFEIAEGTYMVSATIVGQTRPGQEQAYQIVDPALEVDRDRTIVLDARKATEVVVRTPEPARQEGILSHYVYRKFPGRQVSIHTMHFDVTERVYVTPTTRLEADAFEFGTRWSLIAPPLTARVLGPHGGPIDMYYMATSQVVDGQRTLQVVDVGEGRPADYVRRDVRGKAALIHSDWEFEQRARDAAAAGAAMALLIVPEGHPAWSKLDPVAPYRVPIPAVFLHHDQGEELAQLAARRAVRLRVTGVPVSPYLYDVLQVSRGQVPARVVHTVSPANSATVETTYHESGGGHWSKEQRFGWRPWQEAAVLQYQRAVRTPLTRTEVVSAGDTWWQHRVKHRYSWESMSPLGGGMTEEPRTYRPGERLEERWFAPVVRPAIPRGLGGPSSYRDGDSLRIRVPAFGDSDPRHYGFPEGDVDVEPDQGSARLYRNGELLAESDFAWDDYPAGGEEGDYRLDLTVRREGEDWAFSTRTDTSWTFRSSRPAPGQRAPLPLLQLDYGIETDALNQVRGGRAYALDITVRHQEGLPAPAKPRVTVWISYDDGGTWHQVSTVRDVGQGRFQARLRLPASKDTNGFAALRVYAEDGAGATVTQTVRRAFAVR